MHQTQFLPVAAATLIFACAAVLDSGSGAWAQTAGAPGKAAPAVHSHGTAKLQVAVDGNRLTLEFESPLDNLVGFEHAPRTDRQKAAVQTMVGHFLDAATVFVPTPAADCVVTSGTLESPVIDAAALRGAGAKDPAPAKRSAPPPATGARHAELTGTFVFRCAKAGSLRDLEVRLFDFFPGLRRLDVQVAAPQGQKSARLSPGARRISW